MRGHTDAAVRRSVLAALVLALRSPALALASDGGDPGPLAQVGELVRGAATAAQEDPDTLCRALAAHVLALAHDLLAPALAVGPWPGE